MENLPHQDTLSIHVTSGTLTNTLRRTKRALSDWHQFKTIKRDLYNFPQQPKAARKIKNSQRVLIIPSDPWSIGGSKGDEAMILSAFTQMRKTYPDITFGIATGTAQAEEKARSWGFHILPIWEKSWKLKNIREAIHQFSPDCVLIIGADVLDGHYGELHALKMLATADLCVRSGITTRIIGFSFNSRPKPKLLSVFKNLSDQLLFNLRDVFSLGNFEKTTARVARLVADIAFLLPPDVNSYSARKIGRWCHQRRVAGDLVLAVNVHPMLLGKNFHSRLPLFIRTTIEGISSVMGRKKLSVLLISHDYRGQFSDDICLGKISTALNDYFPEKVFYQQEQLMAAELKAVAGAVDGIFTGRMHFAIAGLGMETPVMAVTYQDQKFHGLFAHFEMPEALLLLADDILEGNVLNEALDGFLDSLPVLRRQIQSRLPGVTAAARLNLEGLC